MNDPTLRLYDILIAARAIDDHLAQGDLADGLIFDAVRMRLVEIGEAVKNLPPELLASEPGIPWRDVARMRDHLAHRYFDTVHDIVKTTAEQDLLHLTGAVHRLLIALTNPG